MGTFALVNMDYLMTKATAPNPQPDAERLNAAADQAIAACGGDAREAVKALIVANEFLEREMGAQVSHGYTRGVRHGRFKTYSNGCTSVSTTQSQTSFRRA
jgi:hypothetical protein